MRQFRIGSSLGRRVRTVDSFVLVVLLFLGEVLSLLTPGAPAFTSTSRQQEGGVEGRAEGHVLSCYGGREIQSQFCVPGVRVGFGFEGKEERTLERN